MRRNRLSPVEERFAKLLAEAIETDQLDFFKSLNKLPIPAAETFLVDREEQAPKTKIAGGE